MHKKKKNYSCVFRYLAYEFRVFSVTPFKIDENKNQSRSIKSRIWKTKEGKYAKPFDKIQVTAIFLKEDMRRNVLPKSIEIYLETPC